MVAQILQKIIDKEDINLVLLGKQSIDDDFNQTGQMLAGMMNWPQATFISKITIDDKQVIFLFQVECEREIDGGA